MRKINKIIVHCSVSSWGDSAEIDKWHKQRGWSGNGYHFVILNGKITPKIMSDEYDGVIERGRPVSKQGAHVSKMNKNTIGICLIGIDTFSSKQFKALNKLLYCLIRSYNLKISDILGHYETDSGKAKGKSCPNIDMIKHRHKLNWVYSFFTWWRYDPAIDDLIG